MLSILTLLESLICGANVAAIKKLKTKKAHQESDISANVFHQSENRVKRSGRNQARHLLRERF